MKLGARVYVYGTLLVCAAALGLWRYFDYAAAVDGGHVSVNGDPLPDPAAAAAAASDPMTASAWLASRTRRYHGSLAGWHCDWLIVPVQVEELGFDRATRYLMSGDVARLIADKSHCVTDPFLVDLALGEGLRRYKPDDVVQLAKETQARTILWIYAGHDRQGHMRVTLRVDKRTAEDGAFVTAAARSFEDLAYTDKVSPFAAFDEKLRGMLEAVGVSTTTAQTLVPAGALSADLPTTPRDSVEGDDARGPIDRAARFVLLGVLAPKNESRAAERLLAKAMLALHDVEKGDAATQRMRARILLHLKQRPYALEELRGVGGSEADGLRAVLNGDLPSARAALKDVSETWERTFLTLEIDDIEASYHRGYEATNDEILGRFGQPWAALVSTRLADDDYWFVPNLVELKRSLDDTFPIPGHSLSDIVSGNAAIAQLDVQTSYDLLASRHVHAVLDGRTGDLECCAFGLKPTRGDLLDLFDSRADAALIGRVTYYTSVQGLYERGLSLLESYDEELAGEPRAEVTRAYTMSYQLQRGDLSKSDSYKRKMREAARIAAITDPGQDWPAGSSLWLLLQPPAESLAQGLGNVYCDDYPMRPDWPGTDTTLASRLLFSTDEFQPMQTSINSTARGPKRDALVAELKDRFVGNPDATTLRLNEEAGDRDPDPSVVREAIKNDPDNWVLYGALARLYITQGNYKEASDLALSFPRFGAKARRTVGLSNDAFEIGNALYYHGAIDEARPLLKIASNYNNGSSASVHARARLALLDQDYATAASAFLEAAQHYQDLNDFRDYLELLFAAGESEAGWAGFRQLVQRFKGPPPWVAAVIGHRRDGIDESALRQWLKQESTRADRPEGDEAVATNALMELITDRGVPAADFPEFISGLAGPSGVHPKAGRTFWGRLGMDRERRVGPSEFGRERRQPVAADTVVPNRYALFATAYAELQQGQFDAAAAAFDQLAAYYDVETNDEWGFALPYFALAAAQSGDTLGLGPYLATKNERYPPWGVLLGRAVFEAIHGQAREADRWLDSAFQQRPGTGYWPLSSSYVYVDVCIRLYDITRDERYKRRAVSWAQAHREIEPAHAWAHALVARYGTDPDLRVEALATALYLDPRSRWVNEIAQKDRDAAREWLKKHPPFPLREASAPARAT